MALTDALGPVTPTQFAAQTHTVTGTASGMSVVAPCDTSPNTENWPPNRDVLVPVEITLPNGVHLDLTKNPGVSTDNAAFSATAVPPTTGPGKATVKVTVPWPTAGPTTWPPGLKLTISIPTVAGWPMEPAES